MTDNSRIRSIGRSHPYFLEVSQFAQMVVANVGSLMLVAATRTIHSLVHFVNTIAETGNTNFSGHVNEHTMTPVITLKAANCPELIQLHDADVIHEFMTGQAASALDSIRYEIVAGRSLKTAETNGPARTKWTGSDPTSRFETLTAYLVGGAFERNKALFVKNYGRNPKNWDPTLQFFRHLRNGCFHSNEFKITPLRHGGRRGQPQIDPVHPPSWRSYVMPSDSAMNGQKVVGGFFPVLMVFPFLDEIGRFV